MYTDLTGKFPVTSIRNNKYILVLYDYNSNNIIGVPIKSPAKKELLRGYKQCYKPLKIGNVTLVLHRLDNEVSDDLLAAIKANYYNYQIVTLYFE